MREIILTAVICLSSSSAVRASEPAAEPPRLVEAITVEAAELRALEQRKESGIDRTIITRREMEELGGQTAADVLRRLPRLFFTGPPATNKDVRMAGLDKEFQNVLINGNRPAGGGEKREFALDRIPVEQIERIEVLKTPTAAYDGDAVGGIVNIILKETPAKMSLQASFATNVSDADENGSQTSLEFGNAFDRFSFRIGGTRLDDYRTNDKAIADSGKGEREGENELVRTLTSFGEAAISLRIGDKDIVAFRPFRSAQTESKDKTRLVSALATEVAKSRNEETEEKDSTLTTFAMDWTRSLDRGALLELKGLFQAHIEEKHKKTAQFTGSALKFSKDVLETEDKDDAEALVSADYRVPVAGRGETLHVFSAGVKLRDRNRSVSKTMAEVSAAGAHKDTTNPNDSYSVGERIAGIYLMDETNLTRRLVVTPGLRVELFDGEYETAAGVAKASQSIDYHPSLHVRYTLTPSVLLRASSARVIARPAFKDKVPTRSVKADKVELGNPDLQAATSLNLDLGVERHFGRTGLLAVGAFWKGIADAIEKQQLGYDPTTGLPIVQPVNAGRATVHGAEIEGRGDLGFIGLPRMMLIGNYTWLASEVRDVNTGEWRRMVDQPRSLLNLAARYDIRPIGMTATIGYNYVGEKVNASDVVKGVKIESAFGQWDASLTKTVTKRMQLFASGMNLTNEVRDKTQGTRLETESVGRRFTFGVKFAL